MNLTKIIEVSIVLIICLSSVRLSDDKKIPKYLDELFQEPLFKLLVLYVIWLECCTIVPIGLAILLGIILHRYNKPKLLN
jgi:hypothetical protein